MSNKELIEREKKTIFAKDIVANNPIFTIEEITLFFGLFNLYADQRRECNLLDIVGTAKTLGFDKKHAIVYEAISSMAQQLDGRWIGFEQFLTTLTQRLGHPNSEEGRRAMFELVDLEGKEKLTIGDLLKISDNLGYGLSPDQIQQIVRNIAGPKAREVTWQQFDEQVAKKIDKKCI